MVLNQTEQFELADVVDFRPSVGQLFASSTFGLTTSNFDITATVDLSDGTNGSGIDIFSFTNQETSFARENNISGNSNADITDVDTSF